MGTNKNWLDKYKADLAAIAAQGNVTKSKTSFDIAKLVANAPRQSNLTGQTEWDSYNPFQKVLYADNTQKVMDVLARGNYASASALTEWMRQVNASNSKGHFPMPWEIDKGKVYGAAVDGLEGQSKKTYKDFNTEWVKGLTPENQANLDNTPGGEWGKGISNFLGDVLIDPLTWTGNSVARGIVKGVKAVGTKAGIIVPKASTNVVKALNPGEVAKIELADTGKTVVKSSEANKLVPAGPVVLPKSVVADTVKSVPTLPKGNPVWLKDIVATGVEKSPTAVRAALTAQRDALHEALQGVTGLRYHGLDKAKIPSLYKESAITRPTVKTVEKTVTTPGRAIADSAKFNTVKRLVLQDTAAFKITKKTTKEQINSIVSKIADNISPEQLAKASIRMTGRSGSAHFIPAPVYMDMLSTGKIPKSIPGLGELSVPKNGTLVPIADYATAKYAKYAQAAEPISKKTQSLESATETVSQSTRATGKDFAVWKRALKDVLDPEDITYLGSARTAASFNKRLEEVLAKNGPIKLSSIQELEAAVKAGAVSPEELTRVLGLHGGSKTIKGAQRYLADLSARIDRLAGVKSTKEIVDRAAVGDTKAIDFVPTKLTEAEKVSVSKIVSNVVAKEFKDPQKWNFKSGRGTLRTSPTLGEGLGRNLRGFNKFSQYTLHVEVMREVSAVVKEAGKLTREERMALVYDKYMPLLKAAEDTLISRGINPIVGKGERGLPLSLHDVLSVLPRDFVEHRMMDRLRHIPPTALLDAAGVVAWAIAKGKPIDSAIKETVMRALMQSITGNTFREALLKADATGGKHAIMANSDLVRAAKKIVDAGPQFAASVERNSARASIKYGQYVEALRKETIDNLIKDISVNVGNPSNVLKIVDELDNYVRDGVKKVAEPVLDGAPEQVKAEAIATLANIIPVAEIKSGLSAEKNFLNKGVNPGFARLEDATKTVDSLEFPPSFVADFNDKLALVQGVAFLRNIFPHIGNKDLRPFLLSHESAAKAISTKYAIQLGRINKTYTKGEILEAWKNVQDQVVADTATRVGQAQTELEQAMSTVFNLDPARGVISMSGLTLDHVNSKLTKFGVPSMYRLEGASYKEGLVSFRKWENVKDPLDLLSRVHSAVRMAQADKLIADTIIREFGSVAVTAERNVKIVNPNGSIIGSLLGGHYFSKDIANQLRVLDTTLKELAKPYSSNKLLKLYDSAIHSYKAGLTIYVPAHHMRNLYGDMWLASMDGLFDPTFYKKSIEVLASRKSNYKDFNPDVFNIGALDGSGKPVLTLSYNGKAVPLTADNLYRLAVSKGVLTDYTVIEDLAVGASDNVLSTSVSKALEKVSPFKGNIHKTATGVSEYREHYVRMAHFLYALKQQRNLTGKTLQDAIESAGQAASSRVRKWHPDGSDYSAFERNQLRRFILFYSWIRKAIPLVIESAAATPGRFMLYPKAMYNMAGANGIDLHGYADPFPVDQLFPTWMHDQAMGPQMGGSGGYFGIKQGIPGPDVLEQYFSSPLTTARTIFSGATPAIKLPYEIATQHSSRTGAPIPDWGSWALDQLPYGNRINTLAGDPVGTPAKSNIGYEPQLDIPGGITLDGKGITALNWLSGLGITDMSKPSYIKSAKSNKKKAG